MEMWKAKNASHISTAPTTATTGYTRLQTKIGKLQLWLDEKNGAGQRHGCGLLRLSQSELTGNSRFRFGGEYISPPPQYQMTLAWRWPPGMSQCATPGTRRSNVASFAIHLRVMRVPCLFACYPPTLPKTVLRTGCADRQSRLPLLPEKSRSRVFDLFHASSRLP